MVGKKLGMTHFFDEKGRIVPCTVVQVLPNYVAQIKNEESDGYFAIQTASDVVVVKDERTLAKRLSKPLRGHCEKASIPPCRKFQESRFTSQPEYTVGQELSVTGYVEGTLVDVTALSKGKGFQGGMKLHNFAGGPAAHGASRCHRSLGSTGMRSTPGRCLPGGKRASHMGDRRTTVQNLRIARVVPEDQLLLIAGAIPGASGSMVTIAAAVKSQS